MSVIVDDEVEIKLSCAQSRIVDALTAAVHGGQLLGFIQGFPGAGKTTTAKKMEDVTGSVYFTAVLLVQHLHT